MLIVVDMQPGFSAPADKALLGVLAKVRRAKNMGEPVVLLEYGGHGSTLKPIRDLVPNAPVVTKHWDDGAPALEASGLLPRNDRVRLVGVNTCYCVAATAIGLKSRGIDVGIYVKGCACTSPAVECRNIMFYAKQNGVSVVGLRL